MLRIFVVPILLFSLLSCSDKQDLPIAPSSKANPGVPNVDDASRVPGLFPDPSASPVRGLDVLEQPDRDRLDAAAEVLWGSILGTEKKDAALVRALDGMRVLISGVREMEGEERLYLGIDRKDFKKHDIKNLRQVLEQRFPNMPIHIEASDGIQLLSDNGDEEETPVDLFSEDFTNLSAWKNKSGWTAQTFEHDVPDETDGNKVAVCTDDACAMTTKPMDLSKYTDVTISLHRWIDDAFSTGDKLSLAVGDNGTYRTVATWDEDDGDDVWHYKTITVDDKYIGDATTFRLTVDTLDGGDLFALFMGTETTDDERTVAVDNVLVQGVEKKNPDLTVASVSASPTKTNGGTNVTLRFTVRNTGTVNAPSGSVKVYRHVSKTSNPTSGGTRIGTNITSGSLAAGADVTKTLSTTTPSVSSDRAVYYYVCVDTVSGEEQTDNNCADTPATVTVTAPVSEETKNPVVEDVVTDDTDNRKENPGVVGGERKEGSAAKNGYPEKSYPEPPYEGCYDSPERTHVMGGDAVLLQHADEQTVYTCGTITLGGVETKEGVRGFVTSGHVVAVKYNRKGITYDYTVTDAVFGHGWHSRAMGRMGRLLGKIYKMPHKMTLNKKAGVIRADAAFVAYPTPITENCSLTWKGSNNELFCLDIGNDQIDRVTPLVIRGKGKDVYTVVGSQQVKSGLDIQFTGAVSGFMQSGHVTSERKLLASYKDSNDKIYESFSYVIPIEKSAVGGDSGSPVYTVPDKDGNVRIVGILSGVTTSEETPSIFISSWDDVAKTFDLKPIE